jgi:hypothetical protein
MCAVILLFCYHLFTCLQLGGTLVCLGLSNLLINITALVGGIIVEAQ